jgi:hypothetical protein
MLFPLDRGSPAWLSRCRASVLNAIP